MKARILQLLQQMVQLMMELMMGPPASWQWKCKAFSLTTGSTDGGNSCRGRRVTKSKGYSSKAGSNSGDTGDILQAWVAMEHINLKQESRD